MKRLSARESPQNLCFSFLFLKSQMNSDSTRKNESQGEEIGLQPHLLDFSLLVALCSLTTVFVCSLDYFFVVEKR